MKDIVRSLLGLLFPSLVIILQIVSLSFPQFGFTRGTMMWALHIHRCRTPLGSVDHVYVDYHKETYEGFLATLLRHLHLHHHEYSVDYTSLYADETRTCAKNGISCPSESCECLFCRRHAYRFRCISTASTSCGRGISDHPGYFVCLLRSGRNRPRRV